MLPIGEDNGRYVVDARNLLLAAALVVSGGVFVVAAPVASFGFARPLLGGFLLLLGICAGSLGSFFRPGVQTEGEGCFLFGTFVASGAGALILLAYAGIQSLIH